MDAVAPASESWSQQVRTGAGLDHVPISGRFQSVIMSLGPQQQYLFGWSWLPWDGTFVAAVLALVASGTGLFLSSRHNNAALTAQVAAHKAQIAAQESLDRLSTSAAWFARFQMASTQLESRNRDIKMAGIVLLQMLKDDPAATLAEKALVVELLAIFENKVGGGG